jgi:hypothetical protein
MGREGLRRPGEPGDREGPETRPALPPFVPARGGCLSRRLLCRLSRLPSCAAAAAAEGQELGPGEEATGGHAVEEGGSPGRRRRVAAALPPGGTLGKARRRRAK